MTNTKNKKKLKKTLITELMIVECKIITDTITDYRKPLFSNTN